ncbi:hypothetical protein HanHA89_Chr02g0045961 [Helianthus annuus]|nr:hypothetical protein HanHA89_Chr02g0045961 [Helianthus annuus]
MGKFSHREESRSMNFRSYSERCQSSQHCFENEDPVEQELLIYDIQNATVKPTSVIDVCMLGDKDSFVVEEDSLNSQEPWTTNSQGTVCTQLSGPNPESS